MSHLPEADLVSLVRALDPTGPLDDVGRGRLRQRVLDKTAGKSRGHRWMAGAVAACLLVTGTAVAAAAGLIPLPVQESFEIGAVGSPFGEAPLVDSAQHVGSAPGPEAVVIDVWKADLASGGACYAIVPSTLGAATGDKPDRYSAGCNGVDTVETAGAVRSWISPTTGTEYTIVAAPAPGAASVALFPSPSNGSTSLSGGWAISYVATDTVTTPIRLQSLGAAGQLVSSEPVFDPPTPPGQP